MNFKKLACLLLSTTVLASTFLNIKVSAEVTIPEATLDANIKHQEIDGFGVAQSADVYADQVFYHDRRDEVMDLLFDKEKGIGLSILRSEVGNGLNMPTINPEKGKWDFTPYKPEQWVMNEARKRGVETFMSTVWSPPAWMKTTNRITRGGRLKKENYQDYATYLANYVKGYKKYHGIDIDAISIANEPEFAASWQSNLWSAEEFRDFVRDYLKPTFDKESVNAKVIVGEEGTWTDKRLSAIYADKEALEGIDIIGGHFYHGKPHVFEQAKMNGKKSWLTETSETILRGTGFKDGVKWSRHINDFMTKADLNAFIYWLGASYKTNNESLIRLEGKNNFIDAKRLYSMGNFSKFIRPGYKRVEITENPTGNLHLSAYTNEKTGDYVIVAVNDGQNNETARIKFKGIELNKLTPHITNDIYNLKTLKPFNTNSTEVVLSVSGYTTITYTGNINDKKLDENHDYRIHDKLDDWSKIHSRSENWMIEGYNPYNAFDHDYARARRTKLQKEFIIYELENMKNFEAKIYYHIRLQGLSFDVSSDGRNWTPIKWENSNPILTGGYWERINVKPETDLPENTRFLRINFDKGGKAWDKHLAEIKLY